MLGIRHERATQNKGIVCVANAPQPSQTSHHHIRIYSHCASIRNSIEDLFTILSLHMRCANLLKRRVAAAVTVV